MKVLLVEPQYRRGIPNSTDPPNDETLWYPPIGLLKLARYHNDRGDEVHFVSGCDESMARKPTLFEPGSHWDRIYITTLFTFHFYQIVKTIKFYINVVGGTVSKVWVGGVMASLMADKLYNATGLYPIKGTLTSAEKIGFNGDSTNIDELPCDYSLIDSKLYTINDTYYGYTTRGCTNNCPWCGVPCLEPNYVSYIDIKPLILNMRKEYGDKPVLRLMDNNILASPHLEKIIDDLVVLGYGRNEKTKSEFPKQRTVDFNQGLDASFITVEKMRLLSRVNIKPMRIAFDRKSEKKVYTSAIQLAREFGVESFSNYLLYNFKDNPRDLYDRLVININLNQLRSDNSIKNRATGKIFSYPMRYAPINAITSPEDPCHRDYMEPVIKKVDWLNNPIWTRRFIRNIEIMKGAAHGAISSTPSFALRTIGANFQEFLANLYMPEELLRNRNKHERHVYIDEPKRKPGTGNVEKFRHFILRLLKKQNDDFLFFHNVVSSNLVTDIRQHIDRSPTKEIKQWLEWYLIK